MRMIKEDKEKITWTGMITQALWRAGMLTARIVALVMLCLALNQWALVVLCKYFVDVLCFDPGFQRCSCNLIPAYSFLHVLHGGLYINNLREQLSIPMP